MASAILHIKDSYYFEVPKALWRSHRDDVEDFPEFWVRLDPDYQKWEAGLLYDALVDIIPHDVPPKSDLIEEYVHWKEHGHHNLGKPFGRFLEETNPDWFAQKMNQNFFLREWHEAQESVGGKEAYIEAGHAWSNEKIEDYNRHLSGKVVIPQPFGELNNLYEARSGFAISKFMIIELLVAALVSLVFIRLANRLRRGNVPRGRFTNMLEAMLLYMRDQVARPAIGGKEADRFVPLLWTVFFFILGCNLMGMIPWLGAPTGAWGMTLALAIVILATGIFFGSKKFGVAGFWKNQVPQMGLPLVLGLLIVPLVFAIEVLGMMIRHGVLSIRLLANMFAGHVVLLGIMGLAFSEEGAQSTAWALTAVIAVISAVLFSLLELFVAFLQAFIFTFLSALFIGAAVHHH